MNESPFHFAFPILKWQLFRVQSSCTDHLPPSWNGISTENMHITQYKCIIIKKKALKNLMDRKKENPLLRGGEWIISYEWALALITTRETITIKMQLICQCYTAQGTRIHDSLELRNGTQQTEWNVEVPNV